MTEKVMKLMECGVNQQKAPELSLLKSSLVFFKASVSKQPLAGRLWKIAFKLQKTSLFVVISTIKLSRSSAVFLWNKVKTKTDRFEWFCLKYFLKNCFPLGCLTSSPDVFDDFSLVECWKMKHVIGLFCWW